MTVKKFVRAADGTIVYRPGEQFQAADLASVQKAVNFTALQTLRDYSVVALAIMFALSLIIGWWVAGRALRPVERITTAARDITATELFRRIAASGPRDELRTLADTIDGMLDRLDAAFSDQRRLVEDVSHESAQPRRRRAGQRRGHPRQRGLDPGGNEASPPPSSPAPPAG